MKNKRGIIILFSLIVSLISGIITIIFTLIPSIKENSTKMMPNTRHDIFGEDSLFIGEKDSNNINSKVKLIKELENEISKIRRDSVAKSQSKSLVDIEKYFSPSGYMGDGEISSIKISKTKSDNCPVGIECLKVVYSPNVNGWGGLYWQFPANNWGETKGLNLSNKNISKATFSAKGSKGGEIIIIKLGGISGKRFEDSFQVESRITLSNEWRYYSIDIKEKDLSNVIGGFCFVINSRDNYGITTFFLGRLYYEK
jgi:hypothetical protein